MLVQRTFKPCRQAHRWWHRNVIIKIIKLWILNSMQTHTRLVLSYTNHFFNITCRNCRVTYHKIYNREGRGEEGEEWEGDSFGPRSGPPTLFCGSTCMSFKRTMTDTLADICKEAEMTAFRRQLKTLTFYLCLTVHISFHFIPFYWQCHATALFL